MDNSIGDILNGEPTDEAIEVEEVEAPEIAEEAEPVTAERPRGPDGKFIPKETGVDPQDAEPVPPTTNQLPQAEYAALRDERQKRQQLEERLRQFEEHYAAQQAQAAPKIAPDMFDDPDGFKAHLREEILRDLQPMVQQGGTLTRAEVSEMLARQKYEDYDAKIEVFKEAMESNQFLLAQLQQAGDPATFAYNAANQYLEAKQYGGAAPTREQIEAETREKILAEIGMKPKAPSSFAGDRSVGSRSGPEWPGPTPLGSILK